MQNQLTRFIDMLQDMPVFFTKHKTPQGLNIIALKSVTGVGPSDQCPVFYFGKDGNYLDNGTASIWDLK